MTFLFIACCANIAAAQEAEEEDEMPADLRQVSLGWYEEFASGIDGPGDVAVTRARAAIGFHHKIDELWVVRGQVGAENSRYDWSSDSAFLGSNRPWSEVWKTGAVVQVMRELNEKWTVLSSVTVQSSLEPDAEFDESLAVKVRAGFTWKRDEHLTLGLDLTASSQLEDSVRVLPFPIVEWNFADKWSLESDIGDVVDGPSVSLRRAFSEQFELGATAFGYLNDTRLNDTGVAPGGVLRETRVAAGLEALWKPHIAVRISAFAGYNVWGEFQVDDANGDELDTTDLENAPVLALTAKLYF
jgi:ligand-binding SRPBCC domain-containing protein